jgi:hypothetical protein
MFIIFFNSIMVDTTRFHHGGVVILKNGIVPSGFIAKNSFLKKLGGNYSTSTSKANCISSIADSGHKKRAL